MKIDFKKISDSASVHFLGWLISIILLIVFGFPALHDYIYRQKTDITGEWKIIFEITSSTYNPYVGTKTGYKVSFNQIEHGVLGQGESWEFDSDKNFEAHRPITFNGKIEGQIFKSNYTLFGKERTTVGQISLELNKTGDHMEGEFSGNGADVKGAVKADKILN